MSLALASGCYQRVVETEGLGARGRTTYEPNLEREVDEPGGADDAPASAGEEPTNRDVDGPMLDDQAQRTENAGPAGPVDLPSLPNASLIGHRKDASYGYRSGTAG
jgi:hypothetical protein